MAEKSSGSPEKVTRRRSRAKAPQNGFDTNEAAETRTGTLELESGGAPEEKQPRRRRTRRSAGTAEPVAPEQDNAATREPAESGSAPSTEQRQAPAREGGTQPEGAERSGGGGGGSGGGGGGDQTGTGRRRRRRRRRGGSGGSGGGGGGGEARRGGQQQSRDRSRHVRSAAQNGEEVTGTIEGVLELHPKGYGFLRDPAKNYAAQDHDAFVSGSVIERCGLREGALVRGEVGSGSRSQGPRLLSVESIEGRSVEEYQQVRHFDDLTAVTPFEQIRLETAPTPVTMRVMDLLTPIGKGQRALIVAPPRTGKTMLLQDIADSVSINHPELHLIVLLIDERPEEVTEMRRRVRGEVIASSMDRSVESHVRISQLIIERGKRIAEAGGEVFILLDSITRTARAFNKWTGNTGRTMSGGLDVKALDIPKKMFGTARRFEEGGSLTVVATALIETGSRMDDVIFQEFKGTGNMELVLSRDLADRRIWPAIDITRSGTRHEEKLFAPEILDGVTMLRRSLISLSPVEAMETFIRTLSRFESNAEFLAKVRSVL